MQINISELRRVTDQVLTSLEEKGIISLEIDDDYYWNIPADQRYDLNKEPSDLDLGQLSDDWNELLAILKNQSEPVGYALVWVASMLEALGERTGV